MNNYFIKNNNNIKTTEDEHFKMQCSKLGAYSCGLKCRKNTNHRKVNKIINYTKIL